MGDHTPPAPPPGGQMSLIPYAQEAHQIILKNNNHIVLYDERSRQLTITDASEFELGRCPHCHQLLPGGDAPSEDGEAEPKYHPDRSFMDPMYFALLARSQRPSPANSRRPSPSKGFIPNAIRSGRSRDVSGSGAPAFVSDFDSSEPQPTSDHGFSSSAFNPGFFRRNFKVVKELGRGGNGVVLLVEHVMEGRTISQFACKRIPVGDSIEHFHKLIPEVQLLTTIPHPNIVTPHFVWLENHQASTFSPSIPHLWILLNYCNGGDLQTYVHGRQPQTMTEKLKEKVRRRSKGDISAPEDLHGPSKLTFEMIFSFFRDLTRGLHHLHSKGYIHRDLKPSNCLLHHDGPHTNMLISDFGEVQSAANMRGSTGATGTISYCAPEVLQRKSDGSFTNFTKKSDIFSLGMIVYFMCFGRLPYSNADDVNEENEDLDELRAEISKWQGFNDEARSRSDLPEQLYKYLKRLLSVNPDERPDTDEILASIEGGVGSREHEWSYEPQSSRVAPVDSPAPKPTRASNRPLRPQYASPQRRNSGKDVRSRSPAKQVISRSRPTSPTEHPPSMALSKRAVELPPPSPAVHNSRPQSPRLMLPAPPQDTSAAGRMTGVMHHPRAAVAVQGVCFFVKVLSLTWPCTPYAPTKWVMYPLLGLAALDLGLLRFALRRSLLLLAIHVSVVILARRFGRFCEANPFLHWEAE